jgi:hypothetical protein
MKALIISPGDKFGRVVVLKEAERRIMCGRKRRHFLVRCSCGIEFEVLAASICSGNTTSCGCYGRERRIAARLIPDRESTALRHLFSAQKSGASKRGHDWCLTFEQFKSLVQSPCFYTGRKPSQVWKSSGGSFCVVNGIDRRNNSLGYEISNCIPCCKDVNYAKRALSEQDFLTMIKEVYENSIRL